MGFQERHCRVDTGWLTGRGWLVGHEEQAPSLQGEGQLKPAEARKELAKQVQGNGNFKVGILSENRLTGEEGG